VFVCGIELFGMAEQKQQSYGALLLDALQALDSHDVDLTVKQWQDNAVFSTAGKEVVGVESIRLVFGSIFNAFPDVRHTILQLVEPQVSASDKTVTVAAKTKVNLTHQAPFVTPIGTIPPSGRKLEVTGADFVTFDASSKKIISWYVYNDLLQQVKAAVTLSSHPIQGPAY